MNFSIFENLDSLIEQAVLDSTEKELKMQKRQEKIVKTSGFEKKKKKKESEVEEADDENDPKKDEPEKSKKITGDPKKSPEKEEKNKSPGTTTSKKLADPSPETLKNPNYPDFEKKINALRGGSSLRKKPIASSVKDYIQSLSSAEKAAFLTYLTDLAQIMAPVKTARDVKDLEDFGIQISFKPGFGTSKKKDKGKKEKSPVDSKSSDVIVVGDD